MNLLDLGIVGLLAAGVDPSLGLTRRTVLVRAAALAPGDSGPV